MRAIRWRDAGPVIAGIVLAIFVNHTALQGNRMIDVAVVVLSVAWYFQLQMRRRRAADQLRAIGRAAERVSSDMARGASAADLRSDVGALLHVDPADPGLRPRARKLARSINIAFDAESDDAQRAMREFASGLSDEELLVKLSGAREDLADARSGRLNSPFPDGAALAELRAMVLEEEAARRHIA